MLVSWTVVQGKASAILSSPQLKQKLFQDLGIHRPFDLSGKEDMHKLQVSKYILWNINLGCAVHDEGKRISAVNVQKEKIRVSVLEYLQTDHFLKCTRTQVSCETEGVQHGADTRYSLMMAGGRDVYSSSWKYSGT